VRLRCSVRGSGRDKLKRRGEPVLTRGGGVLKGVGGCRDGDGDDVRSMIGMSL
jgi:hypothetical protein